MSKKIEELLERIEKKLDQVIIAQKPQYQPQYQPLYQPEVSYFNHFCETCKDKNFVEDCCKSNCPWKAS